MGSYATDIEAIRVAHHRIAPYAHRTPVVTCATLDRLADRALFFKCEHLQKVGAFKFRGACNAVMQLSASDAERGVLTHSSGNHAQALALAARTRGIRAYIVMPSNAAAVKRRAVEEYGANVIECEPNLAAREGTATQVQRQTGAAFIHPYNDARVITGQGTAALELLADAPLLDAIITPVGGGGLLSGTCIAAKAINPSVRIIGAEPLGANDAARSLAEGKLIPQTNPRTIADGLRTSLGELTWPIIRDHVDRIVTVDENEIVEAMRLAWERAKLLIEPSAAVAVAAALSDQVRSISGIRRAAVILSGGNVDLEQLPF